MKIIKVKKQEDIPKNFTGIIEWGNGDKWWYQNGLLHREDGPTIEHSNGDRFWIQNGLYHRLDGPAVEWCDGTKMWFQNGKPHRLDGPAIEWIDGNGEYWILNNQLTKEQFNAFRILWGETFLEQTDELATIFAKLVKIK